MRSGILLVFIIVDNKGTESKQIKLDSRMLIEATVASYLCSELLCEFLDLCDGAVWTPQVFAGEVGFADSSYLSDIANCKSVLSGHVHKCVDGKEPNDSQ